MSFARLPSLCSLLVMLLKQNDGLENCFFRIVSDIFDRNCRCLTVSWPSYGPTGLSRGGERRLSEGRRKVRSFPHGRCGRVVTFPNCGLWPVERSSLD